MEKQIYLPMINLTPTMQCNLKCRLCGVLVPQYEYRPRMELAEFQTTLEAVFEIVDKVEKLQITGGEPLLHPQLSQILNACFQYDKQFETLWLFTNCSVPIKSDILKVLSLNKDKVLIHASDYGVKPEITNGLIEAFEKNSIPYRYLKYFGENQHADGWVDQGDFTPHNRGPKENSRVFSSCSHVKRGGSWYIRGGQMHWCGRSIRGTELNKVPLREEDYLNIYAGTPKERKEKLKQLLKADSIKACDFCNGYYGTKDPQKRVPAGEQVKSC